MRDLAAHVLLRAVQAVVPVQVVGVGVGRGEAHATGVALGAHVQPGHHALVAPVCEENTHTL